MAKAAAPEEPNKFHEAQIRLTDAHAELMNQKARFVYECGSLVQGLNELLSHISKVVKAEIDRKAGK